MTSQPASSALRAAVLAIGDEITLGQSLDTNSQWLAQRLSSLGALTIEHVSVPDDEHAIADALQRLARSAHVIVSTGGLGPTADDLTRAGLAAAMGAPLVDDAAALAQIAAYFARRARPMTDAQRSQALRPEGATCLTNGNGTAPGLHGTIGACEVWCLPGPPPEMRPMFERDAQPRIRGMAQEHARESGGEPRGISTRLVHACGIAEADAAAKLGDLLNRARNPTVGITVSETLVTLRIRHEGPIADAPHAIADTESRIRAALGAHVFGAAEDTLAGAILRALVERRETIVCVESCTGGLLAAALSETPGASAALLGGWVTYSNEMKQREVNVPADVIASHGAVSAEVARSMAQGGLHRAGAAHCLAITGIAGPTGASEAKPVGTVYVARANAGAQTRSRRFLFTGDRATVRSRSVQAALAMLWLALSRAPDSRLLGEVPPDPSP